MSISRYDRQRRCYQIGVEGQARIESGRVLIVGTGALGSVVAELLARAGVGYLRLVDRDTVEHTNLQRQALYTEFDAEQGLAKVEAAAARIRAINSEITVEPIACDLSATNIQSVVEGCDLIVDGTDNFETRFLLNDLALEHHIAWVHGGCIGTTGQVFLFIPGKTICFRCLLPNPPAHDAVQTCETAGALGPATHAIASLQAGEALRYLVLKENAGRSKILTMDLWSMRWRELETSQLRRQLCPACDHGERPFLRLQQSSSVAQTLCGRNSVQISPPQASTPIALGKLAETWGTLGKIEQTRFFIRLQVSSEISLTVFKDGRAVISGTRDLAAARTIYARYLGN